MKIYISFGQTHSHAVAGRNFDKDTVAAIECDSYDQGREIAFDAFGDKWHNSYTKDQLEMKYFPGGIVNLNF